MLTGFSAIVGCVSVVVDLDLHCCWLGLRCCWPRSLLLLTGTLLFFTGPHLRSSVFPLPMLQCNKMTCLLLWENKHHELLRKAIVWEMLESNSGPLPLYPRLARQLQAHSYCTQCTVLHLKKIIKRIVCSAYWSVAFWCCWFAELSRGVESLSRQRGGLVCVCWVLPGRQLGSGRWTVHAWPEYWQWWQPS